MILEGKAHKKCSGTIFFGPCLKTICSHRTQLVLVADTVQSLQLEHDSLLNFHMELIVFPCTLAVGNITKFAILQGEN